MPKLDEHCKISEENSGANWKDLHKWIDEPQKKLGMKHRRERHDSSWIPFVKEQWGVRGVLEFLRHIEIDNKTTRLKLEKIYTKNFTELKQSEEKEKEHAKVWELGESNSPEAIPELIKLTKSKEKNERRLAASALGKLARFKPEIYSSAQALFRLLHDEGPQVRQYAIKAISKIKPKGAVKELEPLLIDEKEYNRIEAKQAIADIKGRFK